MLSQQARSPLRGRAKTSTITTEAAPSKAWVGTGQRPEFPGREARAVVVKGI